MEHCYIWDNRYERRYEENILRFNKTMLETTAVEHCYIWHGRYESCHDRNDLTKPFCKRLPDARILLLIWPPRAVQIRKQALEATAWCENVTFYMTARALMHWSNTTIRLPIWSSRLNFASQKTIVFKRAELDRYSLKFRVYEKCYTYFPKLSTNLTYLRILASWKEFLSHNSSEIFHFRKDSDSLSSQKQTSG